MKKLILLVLLTGLYTITKATAFSAGGMAKLSQGIQLSVKATNTTCAARNGKIIARASGGTPPYQYTRDGNSPTPTGNFLSLTAGTYVIRVTDAAGLSADTTVVLTNTFTAPLATIIKSTPPSSCTAQDVNLTLAGSGGLPPYLIQNL